MAGIFNPSIFNNAAFNIGDAGVVVADVVKTGTGGIDPGDGKRRIARSFKPTGLLHLPKKKGGSPQVQARVEESQDIQAEIAARLAREFSEETLAIGEPPPIVEMTLAEVEAEIGLLLRKKLRTDEDEVMLLLMMAAVTV